MKRCDYTSDRVDYIGLSTDTKTTDDIVDGSTFWEVDTSTLYIYYEGIWYAQS